MNLFRALLIVLALSGCQASLPPLPPWQGSERLDHAQLGVILDLRSGRALQPAERIDALAETVEPWAVPADVSKFGSGARAPCQQSRGSYNC